MSPARHSQCAYILYRIPIQTSSIFQRSLQLFVEKLEDIEYDDDEDEEYIEGRVRRRNQKIRLAGKLQDACDYLTFIVGLVNVGIATFTI
jgi:hypothetical protein